MPELLKRSPEHKSKINTFDYEALTREVHLWWIDSLQITEKEISFYRSLLDPKEKAHELRIKNEIARREYIVSHGASRELLGRYLRTDPTALLFKHTAYGKPYLSAAYAEKIYFNQSHSTGLILLALTRDRELGVDLEKHNPQMPTRALCQTVFTEEERAELESLPGELFIRGFFSAWTRKEAFIKATGEGVSADLQSFSVSLDPRKPAVLKLPEGYQKSEWTLYSLDSGDDYEAALVVSKSASIVEHFMNSRQESLR